MPLSSSRNGRDPGENTSVRFPWSLKRMKMSAKKSGRSIGSWPTNENFSVRFFLVGVTNLAPILALIKIRLKTGVVLCLRIIFQLTSSFVYFCKSQTTKEKEIRRSTGQIDGTCHIRPPPAKALEGQRERPIQLASAEKAQKYARI